MKKRLILTSIIAISLVLIIIGIVTSVNMYANFKQAEAAKAPAREYLAEVYPDEEFDVIKIEEYAQNMPFAGYEAIFVQKETGNEYVLMFSNNPLLGQTGVQLYRDTYAEYLRSNKGET